MRPLTFDRKLELAKIEEWERSNLESYARRYGRPMPSTTRLDWFSKPAYVRAVAKAYGLRTFVETGTHEGEMVAQMLREPSTVTRCLSVEIGDECNPGTGYPEKCRQRFRGDARVSLWEGDSVVALQAMLEAFDGPALFWLDAHANGPEDPNPHHFPLREELDFLDRNADTGSVILVDDARFCGFGFWPSLEEVMMYGYASSLENDIVRIEF